MTFVLELVFYPIYSQCTLSLPPENKTLRFYDVFRDQRKATQGTNGLRRFQILRKWFQCRRFQYAEAFYTFATCFIFLTLNICLLSSVTIYWYFQSKKQALEKFIHKVSKVVSRKMGTVWNDQRGLRQVMSNCGKTCRIALLRITSSKISST